MRVNYVIHNLCDACEIKFDKSKGIHCPTCKRIARTGPKSKKKTQVARM